MSLSAENIPLRHDVYGGRASFFPSFSKKIKEHKIMTITISLVATLTLLVVFLAVSKSGGAACSDGERLVDGKCEAVYEDGVRSCPPGLGGDCSFMLDEEAVGDIGACLSGVMTELATSYCDYPSLTEHGYCPKDPKGESYAKEKGTRYNSGSYPVLPALVGIGYDPTRKVDQIRVPLVNMRYSDTKPNLWTSPDGKTYQLPIEIAIENGDLGKENIYQNGFTTELDFAKHFLDWSYPDSKSMSRIGGLYSMYFDLKNMFSNQFGEGKKSWVVTSSLRKAYKLSLKSEYEGVVDPRFGQAIKCLPETYNQDEYFSFLEFFGPFYTKESEMGGILEQQNFLQRCFFKIKAMNDLEAKALADFLHSLDPSYPKPKDQDYVNHRSLSSIDAYGGSPDIPPTPSNYKKRIQSFLETPVSVTVSFDKISSLISDPKIKANMEKAIDAYLAQANAATKKLEDEVAELEKKAWLSAKEIYQEWYCNAPASEWEGMCYLKQPFQWQPIKVAAGQALSPSNRVGACCGGHGAYYVQSLSHCTRNSDGEMRIEAYSHYDGGSCHLTSYLNQYYCHCSHACLRQSYSPKYVPATGPWVTTGCSDIKFSFRGGYERRMSCCFAC